ncbi:UbiA family prenyltransferase [Halorientalis pallida]|uniref:4-hydroxybenzoate polyprenyltransferase n=1 Tax=Halorientalis pallida TaxID=2479928 RepID=A0A498KZG9_9EURY|nr:UbiA family prenyltransferase [Halorientalis pallida]RXK48586.1 4-hydroxybenzoate polyprenyltransferase [Halorientalis pallida]
MAKEEYRSGEIEQTSKQHGRVIATVWRALCRAWRVFQYSSVYVAVLATTEVGVAMLVLEVPPNPAPPVVGLVTFAVYANDRITDVETDALTDRRKAAFVRRFERFLYPLAAGAYGLAVTIAALGGPLSLALTLLPGLFWVFYAANWFDGVTEAFYRLKEQFLLNTAMIAVAWAVTITFLPIAFAGGGVTLTTMTVFTYFFLRVFVLAEVGNIPDREGDEVIGVDTIPVLYGLDGTRRALYLVNLLTIGLLSVAVAGDHLRIVHTAPLLVGAGYSFVVIGLIGRWQNLSGLSQLVESEHFVTYVLLWVVLLLA